MSLISLSSELSNLTILLGVIIFLILLILNSFIITPLRRLRFYKEQGIKTRFIPGLGWLTLFNKAENLHGDNLYYVKENAKLNPEAEIEVSNFAARPLVLLYSPRLLKALFHNTEAHIKFSAFQPMTLYSKWGFSLLEGKMFKHHRQTVSTMFSYSVLGDKVSTMQANARDTVEKIAKSDNFNDVLIFHFVKAYTADNVADLFFGGQLKNITIDGKPMVSITSKIHNDGGELIRSIPLLLFGKKILKLGLLKRHREFNATVKSFRDTVKELIQRRKNSESKTMDLLQVLLETRKSNDPNVAYTDEMIVDEYVSLFVAGSENPAHLIVNSLYLLAKHPEYKKRLLAEIEEIYDKEPISCQTVNKMNLMHALVQEGLRLQSPAFSTQPKLIVKDFEVENYKIKKGAILMPVFYHQNYSEKNYKDAFEFKPERWVDKSLGLEPFKFIPFSAGTRNCVGQHFSHLEVKLLIIEFLKKFDYEINPDYKLRKTQRFLNVPVEPIPFNLKVKTQ